MENKPSSEIPNDAIAAAKEVRVAKQVEREYMFDWREETFSPDELSEIFDSTNFFIMEITDDRVDGPPGSKRGPYWTDRMRWVDMLMVGRIRESASLNHIVCTIRGNPLTFEYIISSELYKYLVCYYEIVRWNNTNSKENKKVYNMEELFRLGRQVSGGDLESLTKEQIAVLNKIFFDGTTIGDCVHNFIRRFRKIMKSETLKTGGKVRANKHNTRKRKPRKKKSTNKRVRKHKDTMNIQNANKSIRMIKH